MTDHQQPPGGDSPEPPVAEQPAGDGFAANAEQANAAGGAVAPAEPEASSPRRRWLRFGAVTVTAIALFVGGYAAGHNAADDDDRDATRVSAGERGPSDHGRDHDRDHLDDDDGNGRFDDDRRERPSPDGFEFHFHLPEDFRFPEDFQFPEDFRFRFPEDFPAPPFGSPQPDDGRAPADEAEAEGFLGVTVEPTDDGVTITSVLPGSPAAGAGLEAGDVVVAVDGEELASVTELADRVRDAGAGTELDLTVRRNGEELTVAVELGSRV